MIQSTTVNGWNGGRGLVLALLVGLCGLPTLHAAPSRELPRPLPSRPGNVFLSGDDIVVQATPGDSERWRVVDYENKVVAAGELEGDRAAIGPLPVGWYRLVRGGEGTNRNRVFFAVLDPLRAPTPASSPISMDVAMAWLVSGDRQEAVANLCALAGFNWVRDRLMWQTLEPERGRFETEETGYDRAIDVQTRAGLNVLQVSHIAPPWTGAAASRFPPDLRDVYRFWRETAERWKGKVGAFEPWNEADIAVFGGHTGSEMATLQKAAYLGLKDGNPGVIACLNVFAIRRASTLEDFNRNKAWPYFDTYNLHHYEALDEYASLYADHRAVSAGRPMWVTEGSIRVRWQDEELKELTNLDLRRQSERLLKTYALELHEGVENFFYFVLPHYTEHRLQYGLLRSDLTPRPGFVAAAAVGRLLADAKPLGRVDSPDPDLHGYLFATKTDGEDSEVLVLWSSRKTIMPLPEPPRAIFDHLGRERAVTSHQVEVNNAPLYAVLERNARPPLVPPPEPPARLPAEPARVVIQALLPKEETVLQESAYFMEPGGGKNIPLYLYNFGNTPARGRLEVTPPAAWEAALESQVELAPGERRELSLALRDPGESEWSEAIVRISGDFGDAGEAVLSFRLVPVRPAE